MFVYYLQKKKAKGTIFLSKLLAYSFMIIHYNVEENIFCRYYLQAFSSKEILNYYINGCFKMVGKRCLKYLKNVNILDSKIIRGKSYLRQELLHNFVNSMVKESKCCRDVIKRDFNEILVIAQKDLLDFHNSTKCLIWDNLYVDGNGKVRDQ